MIKRTVEELKELFTDAMKASNYDLKVTADSLNKKGITTKTGVQWTREGARSFCKRDLPDLYAEWKAHMDTADKPKRTPKAKLPATTQNATKTIESPVDGPAEDFGTVTPPDIPEAKQVATSEPGAIYQEETNILPGVDMDAVSKLVELYQSGKLTEMVSWYETTNEIPRMETATSRPMFRADDRMNTGVMLSKTVRDKALERAQSEPGRVGKSLSQLIEYLLWDYAGRPTDALVPVVVDSTRQATIFDDHA
jgi:hypothetical protein